MGRDNNVLAKAEFSVTPYFSDHAVLQRDRVIVMRGRGAAGAEVRAELVPGPAGNACGVEKNAVGPARKADGVESDAEKFDWNAHKVEKSVFETKGNMTKVGTVRADGSWRLEFPPLPAGGPYCLRISSGGEIWEFSDIYIGEVWLLAGQSNMQLPMERVKYRYPKEYREGASPLIRQFAVPIGWNFEGLSDELAGGTWLTAAEEHTPLFSAVGFFFAQRLYEKYRIPVGLVLTAVGGTPIQAWMSREALEDYPDALEEAELCRQSGYVEKIQSADEMRIAEWHRRLDERDVGLREGWAAESGGQWQEKISLSDKWRGREELSGSGAFWLRRYVDIPQELAGKPVRFSLGTITDADYFYVNGQLAGTITYRYPPREYCLSGLLPGKNLLALRVIAEHGQGGFTRGKKHRIIWEDGTELDVSEGWEYRRGTEMDSLAERTFFERKPVGMYQSMIAPLHDFPIRGVCWYQGETNADEYEAYPGYFKRMTDDWREKWGDPALPVLFVQLPCYDLEDAGSWILFREMQRGLTEIPDTAMAVSFDCGEDNDLPPVCKKPVGERLSMAAFQKAYGESGTWLSPVFDFGEQAGENIILHFANAEDGLDTVDGKEVSGFEYCCLGTGSKGTIEMTGSISVKAQIEGNTVKVRRPLETGSGSNINALVYSWSNKAGSGNLCNRKRLPASPFLCQMTGLETERRTK